MCSPEDHEAVKADESAWSSLEPRGIQPDYDDDQTPADLELRNCTYGSTLCRPVKKNSPLRMFYRRARSRGIDMNDALVYALNAATRVLLASFTKG